MKAIAYGCLAGVLAFGFPGRALAQDSKSALLATQLVAALDAAKLNSVAAKDPTQPDVYVGALYVSGVQLLVVCGKYAAPTLLDARLEKAEYRDVYLDLNGASQAGTKVFIEDLLADGLRARPSNQPPDAIDLMGQRMVLDGEWGRQQLSEQDYMKAFTTADERYAQMLTALLAQLKKG
jgi:hypothetical protein